MENLVNKLWFLYFPCKIVVSFSLFSTSVVSGSLLGVQILSFFKEHSFILRLQASYSLLILLVQRRARCKLPREADKEWFRLQSLGKEKLVCIRFPT